MTNKDLKKGRHGPKRKSIKAKTVLSSKRKLSRMGKEQKKGHSGEAVLYLTRAQALRRLQLSLRDFRRLCILKGIHPRVPKKRLSGRQKSYYHVKDIAFLSHEPIINKFREFKTFMKKLQRAAGRREDSEVIRKEKHVPTYTLDHIVRERYPTFEDAMRDLDDPLCMIYLFANLPAQGRIQSDRTAVCKRLCREWELYCVRSRALRRVFVSVKGTYFQAEVAGERITWLVPHKFAQTLPNDIDFRVMLTFLEFYETLLKFVFFKLYADLGLRYPPRVDADADAEAVHLDAVRLERAFSGGEGAGAAGSKPQRREGQGPALSEDEKRRIASLKDRMGDIARRDAEAPAEAEAEEADGVRMALDEEDEEEDEAVSGDAEAMAALEEAVGDDQAAKDMLRQQREQREFRRLFKGASFFINREVPREMLEFIIRSFGGRVGWEGPGSPYAESDPCITHHVVDRPSVGQTHEGREYVQPQWVFDSINARMRLPTAKYTIGATLPPHLSPFVDDNKEGYIPRYREELDRLKSVAAKRLAADKGEEEGESDGEGDEEEEAEDAFRRELEAERKGVTFDALESARKAKEDEEEDDEEEEEEEDSEEDEEDEGVAPAGKAGEGGEADRLAAEERARVSSRKRRRKQAKDEEKQERHELAESMMSRKAKRLYSRMQRGIAEKSERVKKLEERRAAIEAEEKGKQKKKRQRTAK